MRADVKKCARCGNDHNGLAFDELSRPADEWKWWAMCPLMAQPILLKIADGCETKAGEFRPPQGGTGAVRPREPQ